MKKIIRWLLVIWALANWTSVYADDMSINVKPAINATHQVASNSLWNNNFLGVSALISAVVITFASISPTVMAIAIGGALGSVSRYFVSSRVGTWHGGDFPYGTMAVNILGSFTFGIVSGWVAHNDQVADTVWLDLMTTGFLGGFTTFSTFVNDTVTLSHEEGIFSAALYTGFSVGVSVISVLTGNMVGTKLSIN